MTIKKRKPIRRTPDLTVEGHSLTVFMDKPRGGSAGDSPDEILTSFDPAVATLGKNAKRSTPDAAHLKSLVRILEDCLRTAETIRNKRGTELMKLLRDARRQVDLIDLR